MNIDAILNVIALELEIKKENISFIQQDSVPYIYFEVLLEGYDSLFFREKLKSLQNKLEWLIPGRENDYTWMVSLRANGVIVDTIFGGNTLLPDAGFVET